MAQLNQGTLVSFNSASGRATYLFNVNQVTPDAVDWVNSHIEYYEQMGKNPFVKISPDGLTFKASTMDASTAVCSLEICTSAEGHLYAKFHNELTDAQRLDIQAKLRKPEPFKGLKPLKAQAGALLKPNPAAQDVATEPASATEQTDTPAEQEVSSAQADLAGTEPEAFN